MLFTLYPLPFAPLQLVKNDLRIEVLTPQLVRIEQKGPEGFEDRNTFTVIGRPTNFAQTNADEIPLGQYKIEVPTQGDAKQVKIEDTAGNVVFQWDGDPIRAAFLPAPSANFKAYAIEDSPRIVPPPWGATPPPHDNSSNKATSGWDVSNDAPDIYVFLNGKDGYHGLRKDFLDLTGRTPMPPLAAFGFWDSRYYEYKQQDALDTIAKYRKEDFPLDFFVVDTDWRVNGSHGYAVNTKDFPDMPGFIRDAHAEHVHLMYNDHPEPIVESALAPEELQYRWNGLDELLDWGADVWWYDRNWSTHLHEPAPGLAPEVWGAALYHDMTLKARPNERPLIMSNVQGIDNGIRHYAPSPAFHRYPIWWTGDTSSQWTFLRNGVANGVDSGVLSLLPYVNEDLGGHIGHPTPELYTRYLEYGSLSPITRVHCTKGEDRHPWSYGPQAEDIVRNYLKLRYRLLPTLYSASHQSYVDGTPLLRRCDLEWPRYPEAADDSQYLLGDDILVAPIEEPIQPEPRAITADFLQTQDGKPGLLGEYFANTKLEGPPALTRVDPNVDFEWNAGSPGQGIPKENFTARWTGKLGPMPKSGSYTLAVRVDDGCRLYIDGNLVLDDWGPHAETTFSTQMEFEQGSTHDIRLEYLQLGWDDLCHLEWTPPGPTRTMATRNLWIPPGQWEDLWTGQVVSGPVRLQVQSPLWLTPMFVRRGGIVFEAPEMDYTGQKPWDPMTIDAYLDRTGKTTERELYEDDGHSNGYLTGQFRITKLTLQSGARTRLLIQPVRSAFTGSLTSRRWVVRIHLMPGQKISTVKADGHSTDFKVLEPGPDHVPMPFLGPGSVPGAKGGSVIEVTLPRSSVKANHNVEVQ